MKQFFIFIILKSHFVLQNISYSPKIRNGIRPKNSQIPNFSEKACNTLHVKKMQIFSKFLIFGVLIFGELGYFIC